MSLLLCVASQAGTSPFKRELAFLHAGQVSKAEPKLLHELPVYPAPCPSRQDWHLMVHWADWSLLAGKRDCLYVTALLLSGGGFKAGYIPAWLTRLSFQSLQCSVIHSAIFTMLKANTAFLFRDWNGWIDRTGPFPYWFNRLSVPSHDHLSGSRGKTLHCWISQYEEDLKKKYALDK